MPITAMLTSDAANARVRHAAQLSTSPFCMRGSHE